MLNLRDVSTNLYFDIDLCFIEYSLQLLVVFFSDSSYKSLLVPGGITAHQVSVFKPNQAKS